MAFFGARVAAGVLPRLVTGVRPLIQARALSTVLSRSGDAVSEGPVHFRGAQRSFGTSGMQLPSTGVAGPFVAQHRTLVATPSSRAHSTKVPDSGSYVAFVRFGLDGKVSAGETPTGSVLPWGEVENGRGLGVPYEGGGEKELYLQGGVIKREGSVLVFFDLGKAVQGLIDHMSAVNKSLGKPEPQVTADELKQYFGVTLQHLVNTYYPFPHLNFRLVLDLTADSKGYVLAGFVEKAKKGDHNGGLAAHLHLDAVSTFELKATSGTLTIDAIRLGNSEAIDSKSQ